jgi:hypothetical protein
MPQNPSCGRILAEKAKRATPEWLAGAIDSMPSGHLAAVDRSRDGPRLKAGVTWWQGLAVQSAVFPLQVISGRSRGLWISGELEGDERLWPHLLLGGRGQFAALYMAPCGWQTLFLRPDGATADGKAVAAAIQSAPSPRKSGLAAQALKRLRKIPYWLQRAEMPVITGDSVEFSTWSNLPKTENDAFVVLGGLQENQPPL